MGLTYPSNKICPRCGTGGYVWYLDNSEYVAKCTNCGHYFRREDFPMCVLDEAPKPITNADRIRAMTDEELAEYLSLVALEGMNGAVSSRGVWTKHELAGGVIVSWLNWLKQEVKE